MNSFRLPTNEAARLAALDTLALYDSVPEERFDRITRLAQQSLQVSISLLTLVSSDWLWSKSGQGMTCYHMPREISFCTHVVAQDSLLVVPDALNDPRFATSPLVLGAPFLRFYAGHPVRSSDGSMVGVLCVADQAPRTFGAREHAILADLAGLVDELFASIPVVQAREALSHSEQALRKSQYFVERVLLAAPQIIYVFDLIAQRNIYSNHEIAAVLGYTPEQVHAMGSALFLKLVHPDDLPHVLAHQQQLMIANSEVTIIEAEYRMLHADGTWRWLLSRDVVFLRDEAGRPQQILGAAIDITSRKKAERIKNEFIATVSHELRTPLTSVRGALGLVAGGVYGELPLPALHMVEMALRNSDRLGRLIDDLLDIERIESGWLVLDMQRCSLRVLIEQAIEANIAYGTTFGVAFVLLAPADELFVVTDSDRLLQVMDNLLSNAVKFSPASTPVEVQITAAGTQVQISVSDQGAGIPVSFREQVFEKFAQADSTDSRQRGGTGLGLSIAKALVEQLGGTISFHDRTPHGTTFVVTLPLAPHPIADSR